MARWLDAEGTSHPRARAEPRIVSLVPSVTELLCALGLREQLVGRTGFCIHPKESLREVPKVGGTKDVDIAAIRALNPTHVVVNIDENRLEDAVLLREFVPAVIVTHPLGPEDNVPLYALLGGVFDREESAARLSGALLSKLEGLRGAPSGPPQRVLYLIWREPWMSVARETYISRMLSLFAWHTEPAMSADRYPSVRLEDYAGRIDRVLLSSEPYPFRERHLAEIAQALPGVPVTLIDGEMTSWYGSRAIAALDYLEAYTRAAAPAALPEACA